MKRTLAVVGLASAALIWLGVRSVLKTKMVDGQPEWLVEMCKPPPDPALVTATSRMMSPGYRRLTQRTLQVREVDLAHPRRGCFRSPCLRGRMRPPGRKDARCLVRASCL